MLLLPLYCLTMSLLGLLWHWIEMSIRSVNQCHCNNVKKVASIIYSDDNCFCFGLQNINRSGWAPCVCVRMSSVVYFSVVIIVSINLYWQLGEFVNFLLALSSALKDEPIRKKTHTPRASATAAASNIDATYWHVELSAKIKSNTDTTASHPHSVSVPFFVVLCLFVLYFPCGIAIVRIFEVRLIDVICT